HEILPPSTNPRHHSEVPAWLPDKRASYATYWQDTRLLSATAGAPSWLCSLSPLRPSTMMEAVSASSWRVGGAASRLTPPTITAWDCFGARAKPLPRLPPRARGSPIRPPKASPNGTNNDFPRLCPKMAAAVDHGKADDKAQRTGPRNFVLRRDRH